MQWITAEILSDPELTAYLRMRMDVVTGLVCDVREALPPDQLMKVTSLRSTKTWPCGFARAAATPGSQIGQCERIDLASDSYDDGFVEVNPACQTT